MKHDDRYHLIHLIRSLKEKKFIKTKKEIKFINYRPTNVNRFCNKYKSYRHEYDLI